MKKHFLLYGVCVIVMLCMLAVFLPAQAQDNVIKLKYASWMPPVHKTSFSTEQFCKEIEKRTNGRVKISYFPGGVLVPAPQSYEAAVRGVVDISWCVPTMTTGRFPLSEVMELPLGYKSGVQATALANAFYKKFKPKEYDDTKVLYLFGAGVGSFMTTKPVTSLEGLKGLRMRAGGSQAKIASALDTTPVSVPIPDIYEALQRGVADGTLFYPEGLKGFKLGDHIKGLIEIPTISWTGLGVIVMNKKKWNSLPPDIQKIIDQVSEEEMVKLGRVWDEMAQDGIEYASAKGMKIYKLSPEDTKIAEKKVKPLLDEFVKNMKAKGLPGDEALKFCQDWLRAHP